MNRGLLVLSLWALSLVAAAQIGAAAQRYEAQPPAPGAELRFVQAGRTPNGMPQGRLMAFINGQWMPVTLSELQGGIVPLDSRPQ